MVARQANCSTYRLAPGIDPPGFDRAAYQPQFHAEVTAFLRSTLG